MIELAYLAAGLLLGYFLGWHRGALHLPLGPQRSPRRAQPGSPVAKPEQTTESAAKKFAESKRNQIEADIKASHPHLTQQQRGAAIDEIIEKGVDLRLRM